jgi:hypothetical protein
MRVVRDRELHHTPIELLMVCGLELQQDLVGAGREPVQNHGLAAGVGPDPRDVVDRNVDVSNAWGYGERSRAKDRRDVQILRAVLNDDKAARERFGQRRIDNDLPRRLIGNRLDSRRSAYLSGCLGTARCSRQACGHDERSQLRKSMLMAVDRHDAPTSAESRTR